MTSQTKIRSFFTTSAKRAVTSDGVDCQKVLKGASSSDVHTSHDVTSPAAGDATCDTATSVKDVDASIAAVLCDVGETWQRALESEFRKPYFLTLSKFLAGERAAHTVYPPPLDVFAWTRVCRIDEVKVVILGQDPYHGPGQAHGLCFSVPPGVPPPPSLLNMYKELESDMAGFTRPRHGCLLGWAEQGVLLLNACLTVRAHQANSHKDKGWERLTDAVIAWVNTQLSGVVFLLWGAYAQKKGAGINKTRHHVLTAVHPSPLSAHRGFLGCKHFSQCNALLSAADKTPVRWNHLPE